MWRRVFDMVVVPLLFLAVAAAVLVTTIRYCAERPPILEESVVSVECKEFHMSQYDEIFQQIGGQYGIDWLLLAAIARAESEFKFDAVSRAGAVGLMQVMPPVAKSMGYNREQLFDAEVSVEIAAKLLIENERMLHLHSDMATTEQWKFILACYNAGYSRIADARRLARYHDDDANRWSIVATYLALLAEPEFAEHEVVQSGAFFGSDETIAYVNKVIHIYNLYKNSVLMQ